MARPEVGERRAQLRLACGEAQHFGGARLVIVPGRTKCRVQVAQLRRDVDHRRRVARLGLVAGTRRLCKGGLSGRPLREAGVDQALELALPLGELGGGGAPFLGRGGVGGLDGGIRIRQPAFEVLGLRDCRGQLRGELRFALRQAFGAASRELVLLPRAFRLDGRGAQLFVDHFPTGGCPCGCDFELELALGQLSRCRGVTPLGLLKRGGGFRELSFELDQPRMVRVSGHGGRRCVAGILGSARTGDRADDDHRQVAKFGRVPLDVVVRVRGWRRGSLSGALGRDHDDGGTRDEAAHAFQERAPAFAVGLAFHDQGGDVLILGNPGRGSISGRRPGDRPVACNCTHRRGQVLRVQSFVAEVEQLHARSRRRGNSARQVYRSNSGIPARGLTATSAVL